MAEMVNIFIQTNLAYEELVHTRVLALMRFDIFIRIDPPWCRGEAFA